MAGDNKERVFGVILLRIALAGGLYVIVYLAASFIPMPGVSTAVSEFINRLWELALWVGLIAPLVAIVGAALLRFRRRRFRPLDWVSLAVGVSCGLPLFLFMREQEVE